MKCTSFSSLERRPQSDACILPFAKDDSQKIIPLFEDGMLVRACHHMLETKDFSAKEGETVILYPDPAIEKRLVVVGCGEEKKLSSDSLRTSFAKAFSLLAPRQVASASMVPPTVENVPAQAALKACLEGVFFGTYAFREYYVSKQAEPFTALMDLSIFSRTPHMISDVVEEVQHVMEAVSLARDLVNRNADEITPDGFAAVATSLADQDLRITVHGKEWIEHERMQLLLAVGRGAHYEPRFVVAEWKGAPGDADTTVFVGKGITFDTGGLNLKTEGHMQAMKGDMAGAAAVLATMKAVRDLRLPLNVTGVMPLCENSIGEKAYKPGDVYTARSGKTVEIGNTDAEGRLILADALDYAVHECSPSRIIDVATLTGAAEVALGSDISALFSNTDALSFLLERASQHGGDPLWRLPLYLPYEQLLDSDIADCKNLASRAGGAVNAAIFLNGFIGTIPWAHLDIAGTAFLKDPWRYYGKGATGVPVRTLVTFLQSLISGGYPPPR